MITCDRYTHLFQNNNVNAQKTIIPCHYYSHIYPVRVTHIYISHSLPALIYMPLPSGGGRAARSSRPLPAAPRRFPRCVLQAWLEKRAVCKVAMRSGRRRKQSPLNAPPCPRPQSSLLPFINVVVLQLCLHMNVYSYSVYK